MFLAEETEKTGLNFTGFDIFMIAFTIVLAFGVYRMIKAEEKNKFAIGFAALSLLTFLAADVLMVLNWVGVLDKLQG